MDTACDPRLDHLQRLTRMFLAAPINKIFRLEVALQEGKAILRMEVGPEFLHPGGSAHGVVHFKLLDSCAFLAANSLEKEFLMVTTQFSIQFKRPLMGGNAYAKATVVRKTKDGMFCEARLFSDDKVVAEATGTFKRSRIPLGENIGYT